MYLNQIELLYAIPIGILISVLIATFYGKLSMPIGFIGVMAGIGIAWLLSPYIALIMNPLTNCIWYGYEWTLLTMFGLLHIISVFVIASESLYNLYLSGGIKTWA
jgi:hypothetical protein